MKRILLSVFFLPMAGYAQLPKLLPDTSVVWVEGGGCGEWSGGRYIEEKFVNTKYVIYGDTIVDGKKHKNIYQNQRHYKFYEDHSTLYHFENISKYGFTKKIGIIRQDSLKVIVRILNDSFLYVYIGADSACKTNTDYILYDLGKTVGDTLYPAFSTDTAWAWVIKNDTFYNGRRVLGFQEGKGISFVGKSVNYIMEGTGFVHSFFTIFNKKEWKNKQEPIACSIGITNFCIDNQSLSIGSGWPSSISNCAFDSIVTEIHVGLPDISKDVVSIYPNPATNIVFIDNLPQQATITIFDIALKEVGGYILSEGDNSIDVSLLPQGVYFLKILSNNVFYTQKIIKTE